MSSTNKNPPPSSNTTDVNSIGKSPSPLSSPALSLKLGVQLTNEEVEEALNFDMDFDGDAHTFPNMSSLQMSGHSINDSAGVIGLDCNLDGFHGIAGSMGTRSPSPNGFSVDGSESLLSQGSKRSRAEFDNEESDTTDGESISNKRRFGGASSSSRGGLTLGLGGLNKDQPQAQAVGATQNTTQRGGGSTIGNSPATAIRQDREQEGRCPDCGLETHTLVRKEQGFVKEPLTIEGEVLNGRCLFCNPLKEGEAGDESNDTSKGDARFSTGYGRMNSKDGNVSKKGVMKTNVAASAQRKGAKIKSEKDEETELDGPFSEVAVGSNKSNQPPFPPSRPSSTAPNSSSMGLAMVVTGGNMGGSADGNYGGGIIGMGKEMSMTAIQGTPQQNQRQQLMRNMQSMQSLPSSGNHHFSPRGGGNGGMMTMGGNCSHPQGMQHVGGSGGNQQGPGIRQSSSTGDFSPVPTMAHSKMAAMKQRQLPRKHSPKQHAMMAFGNTSNRGGKTVPSPHMQQGSKQNWARRESKGSDNFLDVGMGNNPMSQQQQQQQGAGSGGGFSGFSNFNDGNKNGMNNKVGGGGWQQRGSLNIMSPPSMSEGSNLISNPNVTNDGDDGSRVSQISDGMGGLGKAMAMGMGMSCIETMMSPKQSKHPKPKSPHPQRQSPHPQRRSPLYCAGAPDPPSSSISRGISSTQSDNDMELWRQSMQENMNNMKSRRQHSAEITNNMNSRRQPTPDNMNNMPPRISDVPPHIRLAHSKLSSSIYHHHNYPLNNETERAYMDKTLTYLESGSGDICDIIVAMRRFPFSLAIQSVACEKLYVHCFDRDHAYAIGLVGGIRTIIDAMENHPGDVALQRGCAGIIKHLSIASPYNLDMLDRMGAVAIIVTTMERHPQSAPLLESCCWALESMARGPSQELKMRVAKGGGIHAAMKAVETFPNNESLLRAAFHCLRQLGYNPLSYNSNQQRQQRQHPQQHQQNPFLSTGGMGGSGGNGGMQGHGQMMMPRNSMMGDVLSHNAMMGDSMSHNAMMGDDMPHNLMMGDNNNKRNMR